MTKGMFERGLRYGIINEFNMLDNIVADFDSLWKMLPAHQGKDIKYWKNPDYLINASLWELESPNGSLSSLV